MEPSWRPGCPVPLEDLRYVTVTHRDFAGEKVQGELVVHADGGGGDGDGVPRAVRGGLPGPVDAAGRRLRCERRRVDGRGQHVGLQLPGDHGRHGLVGARVRAGDRRQPGGEPVRARAGRWGRARGPGVRATGPTVRASSTPATRWSARSPAVGWLWGGDWDSPVDYQHFSRRGGEVVVGTTGLGTASVLSPAARRPPPCAARRSAGRSRRSAARSRRTAGSRRRASPRRAPRRATSRAVGS